MPWRSCRHRRGLTGGQSRFLWMKNRLLLSRTRSRFDAIAESSKVSLRVRRLPFAGFLRTESNGPDGRSDIMKIFNTVEEMRASCRGARAGGKRLGFVATMGAL